MRRLVLMFAALVFLAVTMCHPSISRTSPSPQINPFAEPVLEVQGDITKWERDANIQIGLVIGIIVFGALITVFQSSKQNWCKTATVALGIATSVLTGISAKVFPADYRSYQNAATEGKAVLKNLEVMNAVFQQAHPVGPDLTTFTRDFTDRIDTFNSIAKRLEGSAVTPSATKSSGIQLLRPVYAQAAQEAPSWVQNLPSDSRNLYFRGKSSQSSLSRAKSDSFNEAIKQASAALTPSEIYTDTTLVRDAAVAQDTFFTFDKNSSMYVYYTLLRISRGSLQPSPYVRKHWRPVALAYNSNSGLFVFDDNGVVSQVRVEQTEIRLQELFRLKVSDRPADLTVDTESLFATSNNSLGCTVYQYSLANKKTSQKLIGLTAGQQGCDGIAAENGALYVVLARRKEIRYWPRWGVSTYDSWNFQEINPEGGVLALDKEGNRLIYAAQLGTAYGISLSAKKIQALASDIGAVHAIAKNSSQILLASGKKVLFYARADFQGENPPATMQSLTGGNISGVAVDSSNSAWVADFDNGIIEGPFPLS